jgi:hypothetical protein
MGVNDVGIEEQLFSVAKVAERLGISARRVRAIASGHEIGSKPGRDWVFTASEIERMALVIRGVAGRPRKEESNG